MEEGIAPAVASERLTFFQVELALFLLYFVCCFVNEL